MCSCRSRSRASSNYRRGPDGSWIYRSAGSGDRVTLANGGTIEVGTVFDGVFEIVGH